MSAISQYHDYVYTTPWGELFYELLWDQLEPALPKNVRILDYGSGFGKTAHHLSKNNEVVAYEPDQEMLQHAERGFTQLGRNERSQLATQRFDVILVHNVLEYVPNPAALIADLQQHLTAGGCFSIVKHNALGHVFASAVLNDDPVKALAEYEGATMRSQSFGAMSLYSLNKLTSWLAPQQHISQTYGLRTVFGLSANNDIKGTAAWHDAMFALEQKLASDPQAQAVAFFQHVITAD
ncbi:MAG: class I SAM-dependent methyltransferase [Lactobacillus sp.]|uniref:Class I SAM-dependent methyltransferase n=1 Tax=Lacticaseibacillus suilingensis TaxID=2799577 RepID=A0ABW4BJ98_9LACO|nr:class I SAM-dependent methyltransferase [Lacticaseibacillus suilingensis]MCI1893311.1 class I SAM-dependent methyltransferase [Lactobacillus sp.]MCI1918484.1 class I SAM-dependent methyltransferase [Lactobacillus sp.]MCI1940496.1 class I SAM-dependent methyltransferase [Lactobacillus sp.]MCI2017842.1 class I SAM-dependent methyltransferase [Lactobacillus sp.]MCI2038298.1 class I SAM-dependent methyltransferase [Lactobacillus sp.]